MITVMTLHRNLFGLLKKYWRESKHSKPQTLSALILIDTSEEHYAIYKYIRIMLIYQTFTHRLTLIIAKGI